MQRAIVTFSSMALACCIVIGAGAQSAVQDPIPEPSKPAQAEPSPEIDEVTATPMTLQWLPADPDPADPNLPNPNFRLAATHGFSVVRSFENSATGQLEQYRLYATSAAPRARWAGPRYRWMTDLFYDTIHVPPTGAPHCYYASDPREWSPKCIETLNLFWKQINCTGPNIACTQNDRWNAYTGNYNMTSFPLGGVWPKVNPDYGIPNHTPIINKDSVNSVSLLPAGTNCTTGANCPPKTGTALACHPNNPDEYATGTANSKVVKVTFPNGASRWFMAFNSMIHFQFGSYDPPPENGEDPPRIDCWTVDCCNMVYERYGINPCGTSAADKWRILWATLPDGKSWTIDRQILVRGTGEQQSSYCGLGALVTDMIVDTNQAGLTYFYLVFTDVGAGHSYLARSLVNETSPTGYGTWEIATNQLDGGGFYIWRSFTLGAVLDFGPGGLNAYPVMKTFSSSPPFMVKQATIGRVFTNDGVNYRYLGITMDKVSGAAPVTVQLWATRNLARPFTFESTVTMPSCTGPNSATGCIKFGAGGFEPAFTHYSDNNSTTPRIFASGFDLWVVEEVPSKFLGGVTVTRRRVKVTGGPY